jgi:hypothetical protein
MVKRFHKNMAGRENFVSKPGRMDHPLRGRYVVFTLGIDGKNVNASFLAVAENGSAVGLAQEALSRQEVEQELSWISTRFLELSDKLGDRCALRELGLVVL